MNRERTQVGIVGAGPAGLVLAHLLHLRGIDSVVLELHSREHVERRIRAGVLEHGTVELLTEVNLADRLLRERMVHHGLELLFDGVGQRIPLTELTGREITIYGQHELVKDLIVARLDTGRPLLFEASGASLHNLDTDRPAIRFGHAGARHELACDIVAGCDGYHGVSRSSIPDGALVTYARDYPYAWLGILAQTPPSSEELIYAYHERGFALHSMRSPRITRLYLQVRPDEDLAEWPDERIWAELGQRLSRRAGFHLADGRSWNAAWPRCAASSSTRCGTGGCSSPATRHISCLRPAPRGSTWPSPTCPCWPRRSLPGTPRATGPSSTPTARPACAGSGGSSTSPGG